MLTLQEVILSDVYSRSNIIEVNILPPNLLLLSQVANALTYSLVADFRVTLLQL